MEVLAIIIMLPLAAIVVGWLVSLTALAIGFIALPFGWALGNQTVWLLAALFGAYCVVHSMIVSWP